MEKQIKRVLIISLMFVAILSNNVFAKKLDIKKEQYTQIYKAWQNLPDEQKTTIIEPSKYCFNNKRTTNENIMSNNQITLKDLRKILLGSAYSSNEKFNLKTYISNNLKIKDQEDTEWCWAFSSIGSLETNMALNNYINNQEEKIYDYSEKHMVYMENNSFLEGQTNTKGWSSTVKDGGTYYMSTSYLTNGSGAINESDMEFDNSSDNIDISEVQGKKVQTTVNDVKFFQRYFYTTQGPIDFNENKVSDTDFEKLKQEIKEHISTSGSVYSQIYFPTMDDTKYLNIQSGTLYVQKNSAEEIIAEMRKGADGEVVNHAVSIVGWDDKFDKSNFRKTPQNNGAWIVRNSYGVEKEVIDITEYTDEYTDEQIIAAIKNQYGYDCTINEDRTKASVNIGDDGFFYISYEDVYIYSGLMGIEKAEDKVTYNSIYQFDETGGSEVYTFNTNKDLYLANVFSRKSTDKEYIKSVGITSLTEGEYEVYINPNNSAKTKDQLEKVELVTGDNISLSAGYHTIEFEKPYQLTGANFVIVLKMNNKDGENAYVTVEDPQNNKNIVLSNAGESFVTMEGYKTDNDWLDIADPNSDNENYMGNLCIKAIALNNYTGEIANGTDNEENPSGNTTNTVNATNTTNTVNETNTTNTVNETNTTNTVNETNTTNTVNETNTTNTTVSESTIPENSSYDSATSVIDKINVTNNSMYIAIKVSGIQPKKNMDKYEYYFYITNDSNKTQIEDSKWIKATSYEKQKDGTYTVLLEVTDSNQINYETQGENLYIYIKENVYKGNNVATKIFKNKLDIYTSSLQISSNGEVNIENKLKDKDKDNTIINKNILPYTGMKSIIIVIGIISILFILFYIEYKKLYDIK